MGKPFPVPASGSIARISLSPRLTPRIKEILSEQEFDIVHLHEPFVPMLCTTMLRHSNAVTVGTFHATEGKPGYRLGWPINRIVLKRWARKLDGKIACCKEALGYASQYVPGPYEVIPDGVDLEHFSPHVPPVEQYSDDKTNILFVGRGEKRKGFPYLMSAYHKIKRKFPQSRLIVVGPGHEVSKSQSRRLFADGIKDLVFVGPVSHEMLPRYYQTADIFCSPATGHESFGIVLLEAMAHGKPVIATDIPGHASWITNGKEGLLVPPKDVSRLAQALIELIAGDQSRREMGDSGLATARSYSVELVARNLVSFYKRLLEKTEGKPV
jgi:phosphatidylinositol alpha-mannosyltransferase